MRRGTLVLLSAASAAYALTPRATPKALALTLTSVSAVVTYGAAGRQEIYLFVVSPRRVQIDFDLSCLKLSPLAGIWGNDSQNKKPCLKLLLPSYLDITLWDATAMHLWNGKDYLGLFRHFLAIEWRLDIGYPGRGDDSEIKSTTVANRQGAKQQLAARKEVMKIFS